MTEHFKFSVHPLRFFPFSFRQGIWTMAFMLALAFTLFEGSFLWLARIGWVLLAILFCLHRRYAIYSVFFFAAFFQPAGFLHSAPMSLKHFHIASALLITVDLLQGVFFERLEKGLGFLQAVFPVLIVLALGCVVSLNSGFVVENFRTPLNVLFVLSFLYYLYCSVATFGPEERLTILRRSVLSLCAGMALQCGLAVINNFGGSHYWGMQLFHDNHMGNLNLFAFFYMLPLYASSKKSFGKRLYFILLLIIFGGIVASCSRTAWLSGFLSFCVFTVMSWRFLKKNVGQCVFHAHILPIVILLIASFFLMMLKSETVAARVLGLQRLCDIEYWRFTFSDHQNFGFLGIFRLEQYILLKDILFQHCLLGVGFIKKVVDMHGLHLVILGATGCIGFSIFLVFCIRYLVRIYRALSVQMSEELLLMLAGSFCAFLGWIIMSFMLTLIVHFIVWINVMLGVLLAELSKDLADKRPRLPDPRLQATEQSKPLC